MLLYFNFLILLSILYSFYLLILSSSQVDCPVQIAGHISKLAKWPTPGNVVLGSRALKAVIVTFPRHGE